MLSRMAGGMNRRGGHVAPIGVRAGLPEPEDARPWERPRSVVPRDAHVLLEVDGVWVQALLVEQRRDGDGWVCRVVWAARGTPVRDEWVPAGRVKVRSG